MLGRLVVGLGRRAEARQALRVRADGVRHLADGVLARRELALQRRRVRGVAEEVRGDVGAGVEHLPQDRLIAGHGARYPGEAPLRARDRRARHVLGRGHVRVVVVELGLDVVPVGDRVGDPPYVGGELGDINRVDVVQGL